MSDLAYLPFSASDLWPPLRRNWRLIVATTALGAVAGLAYALVIHKPEWSASQAIVLRDEAVGDPVRQARFENTDQIKAAQETVLDVAHHPAVVEAALRAIGPPPTSKWAWGETAYPSPDQIARAQGKVSVTAPGGMEFGQTEVIYLSASESSRDRAIQLIEALVEATQSRLRDLRTRKAQSIVAELSEAVVLARRAVDLSTAELAEIESAVGIDLGELRLLAESGSGDSHLRAQLGQIQAERRQLESERDSRRSLIEAVSVMQRDPTALLGMSNDLLTSQPSLRRLREGLVDAQLRRANLTARMTADHPEVRAAVAAEASVLRDLQAELKTAAAGLQSEADVVTARGAALARQEATLQERLAALASMRSKYAAQLDMAKQRQETLRSAERKLAEAEVRAAAAAEVSLITTVDTVIADLYPQGPGRTTIVAGGLFGGLAIGVSLVLAVASVRRPRGRRATDYLPPHLRPAGRNNGRRGCDRELTATAYASIVPQLLRQTGSGPKIGRRAEDRGETASSSQPASVSIGRVRRRAENNDPTALLTSPTSPRIETDSSERASSCDSQQTVSIFTTRARQNRRRSDWETLDNPSDAQRPHDASRLANRDPAPLLGDVILIWSGQVANVRRHLKTWASVFRDNQP